MNVNIISSLIAFMLVECVSCHPVGSEHGPKSLQFIKDEVKFPNGTVVGKYAYVDPEGNPIQVKYYADDSSYGVELNSVKVVSNNIDTQTVKMPMQGSDTLLDTSSELIDSYRLPTVKKNKNEPFDYSNKASAKTPENNDKLSIDYDVYMQTDVNGPNDENKCNKDKIRIYNFDKDKRKIRSAYVANFDDATKVCEQF